MKGLLSLCNVPLLKNITLFISKLVDFFLNYVFLVLVEILLSLIVRVPIHCIFDFLYCSNCNRMFILSCFFLWPHVAHFHMSECTNKILLLMSIRITDYDKPLITEDMLLTWQLLDTYTSYYFISIVFQMCKKIKIICLILYPKCNTAYHFNCINACL